jgi:hypothetical protein
LLMMNPHICELQDAIVPHLGLSSLKDSILLKSGCSRRRPEAAERSLLGAP